MVVVCVAPMIHDLSALTGTDALAAVLDDLEEDGIGGGRDRGEEDDDSDDDDIERTMI